MNFKLLLLFLIMILMLFSACYVDTISNNPGGTNPDTYVDFDLMLDVPLLVEFNNSIYEFEIMMVSEGLVCETFTEGTVTFEIETSDFTNNYTVSFGSDYTYVTSFEHSNQELSLYMYSPGVSHFGGTFRFFSDLIFTAGDPANEDSFYFITHEQNVVALIDSESILVTVVNFTESECVSYLEETFPRISLGVAQADVDGSQQIRVFYINSYSTFLGLDLYVKDIDVQGADVRASIRIGDIMELVSQDLPEKRPPSPGVTGGGGSSPISNETFENDFISCEERGGVCSFEQCHDRLDNFRTLLHSATCLVNGPSGPQKDSSQYCCVPG